MINASEKKKILSQGLLIPAAFLLLLLADGFLPNFSLHAIIRESFVWGLLIISTLPLFFGETRYLTEIKFIKDEVLFVYVNSLTFQSSESLQLDHIKKVTTKKRIPFIRPFPRLIIGGPGLVRTFFILRSDLTSQLTKLQEETEKLQKKTT